MVGHYHIRTKLVMFQLFAAKEGGLNIARKLLGREAKVGQ